MKSQGLIKHQGLIVDGVISFIVAIPLMMVPSYP